MSTSEKTFLTHKTRRIVFVMAAFFLFYLVSFLIDPYARFWKDYFQRDKTDLLLEWLISFSFCYVLAEASLFIHNLLNKYIPWTKSPAKRLVIESILNIFSVFFFIVLNGLCLYLVYNQTFADQAVHSVENTRDALQYLIVSLVISFMFMGINTGSYLINNWKSTELQVSKHKLRVSELRQASVEAELNALKLQLDPHFIFNNLSVLSELILEDQNLGYQYSENFAKVYRFLLLSSKKNLIPLSEELKFLNAYIFLIKHRIGIGIRFEISVNKSSDALLIPPLTLQLLIENAIKHNRTSKNNPLHIEVYSDGIEKLVVKNVLSPLKSQGMPSTGIGLANIISRFNLLSMQPPEIFAGDHHFKVVVHLIKYDK
jgi:two-component system LytT family sensor kinase